MSDRERELVEAARLWLTAYDAYSIAEARSSLANALRAYDPPKVKKYTMPSWEDFTRYATVGGTDEFGPFICAATGTIHKLEYNSIREALATEEEDG